MRRLGDFEFRQYESARFRLSHLYESQARELKEAYADIHPTRVGVDYSLGRLFSESASVEEHAIYIADLKAEHERQRDYWHKRAAALQHAVNLLDAEQRNVYDNPLKSSYRQNRAVKNRLRELLQVVIAEVPELQRKKMETHQESTELVDAKEWDRMVDAMSGAELFTDYYAKDEVAL